MIPIIANLLSSPSASGGITVSNPTKISWTDPTTNTNGTAIAAGEITGYLVGIRNTASPGSAPGTYPTQVTVSGASAASELISAITPVLAPGAYAVAIQAIGPVNSAWSAESLFTISPTPNPPSGVAVA
jgi:hypothetical protein